MRIVYDDNLFPGIDYDDKLLLDFGFSCIVEEKGLLFDTGGNAKILANNLDYFGQLDKIKSVFLSHNHLDHVGGMPAVLENNSDVTIYAPSSLSTFRLAIYRKKAPVHLCTSVEELLPQVFTTGVKGSIPEHSLVFKLKNEWILLTGCSHQGIVTIIEDVQKIIDEKPLVVIGGFHLSGASEPHLKKIARILDQFKIKLIGPSHCSGNLCRKVFADHFGPRYIRTGVGWSFSN